MFYIEYMPLFGCGPLPSTYIYISDPYIVPNFIFPP
jgi:hypothetical protein